MRLISKNVWTAALAATLVTGAPVVFSTAANAQGDSEATSQEEVSVARRIVCRQAAPTTGTRLGARRICRTQADWDRAEQEARNEVRQQQDRGHFSSGN